MGQTIAQKIIAAHAGRDSVDPGDLLFADVDVCLANDITAPIAIDSFREAGFEKVFDTTKVVLVPDHFTPNKDIDSAEQVKLMREFARAQEVVNYFEVGRMGIEHALLPEQGIVVPGDLVVGADSHTCTYGALGAFSTGMGSTDIGVCFGKGQVWLRIPETIRFIYNGSLPAWVDGKDLILLTIGDVGTDGCNYKVMELTGQAISEMDMDGRFSMCNMAIEAGAKAGIIAPDEKTEAYVKDRAKREYTIYASDSDASYADVREYDVSGISPQVAAPFLPSNTSPVEEFKDVQIDQVVIGSCTNGRITDLRVAAKIIAKGKVDPSLRVIVIPATQQIYLQALEEGLIETFVKAGAVVSTPTCGPCLGGHMGILASGEKALATTNRNFRGRMGHPDSEVYLCGPAVAAASALTGRITHPAEI
ncbi:3-isopropylmalate dehydratase large subunit [Planctomycetota bacterium]